MEYIDLATTGIRVSRIGLGTWAIGGLEWGGADDEVSIATIHCALDLGITLVDTAPIYGFGRSEDVIGRALKDRRDRAIIATKVGLGWSDRGDVWRDGSRARIEQEVESSLRRLQTDRIDIYQMHWPHDGRIDETAESLGRLFTSGKIRAIGVSNFSTAQMERFRKVAPLHTVQPPYNLFERAAEKDVLPYAAASGIVSLTYGALCRGLLSGRMKTTTRFSGDDMRLQDPKFQPPRFGQYIRAVQRLDDLARERYGRRVQDLAMRFALDQQGVSVALRGARRPQQLDDLHHAFGFHIDADARAAIEHILAEEIKDPVGLDWMAPPEDEVLA